MKIFVTGGCGFIGSNFVLQQVSSGDNIILNLDKLTYAGNPENLTSIENHPNYEFIQADICDIKTVTNTIEKLVYGNYDSVWTVSETDSKYHPFKQLQINDKQLHYFDSDQGKTIVSRHQLDPLFYRNGAAYSMTRNYLMKNKNDHALPLLSHNIGFVLIDDLMVNIDYPWEFKFAEFILANNNISES